MSESASASAHPGPTIVTYLGIFVALSVFTTVSFVVYEATRTDPPTLSKDASFWIIMAVAVAKALCVAAIFMHLKYDWGKVYFLIIPALVLGVLVLVVLMPDMVLGWRY